MSRARDIRGRLADERGFTVVEAMIAALLLVIGSLGTLQIFDAGTRNTYRAEESQVLNDRLQRELEAVKQLPYEQIALTTTPARVADTNDPRWRVAATGATYAVGRDGTSLKTMAVNGGAKPGGGLVSGGAVNPGPESFTAGDVSGQIYRFVTWTSDPSCSACGSGAMKRVIVAARIDEAPASSERAFQEIQSDVVDPEATPNDNPGPPDEEVDNATASFWLTDTPCSEDARIPPTADHLAHNTRGICDDGSKTGETRGAPDLMYTEAPVIDPENTTLYDYATDPATEPLQNPTADKGLAMPKTSTDSCLLQPVLNTLDVKRVLEGLVSSLSLPTLPGELDGVLDLGGGTGKHYRMHSWVSPPVQGSGGVLTGRGTLELFTKTVNGAVHSGEVCAWLFIRQKVEIPIRICVIVCLPLNTVEIEVDIPVVNVGLLANGDCRTGTGLNLTNFQYAQNPWPREWAKISIPMCFAAVNAAGAVVPMVLPPESRVGLAMMVKRGGTSGDGLEFMYDAVGYESRLELETDRILSF